LSSPTKTKNSKQNGKSLSKMENTKEMGKHQEKWQNTEQNWQTSIEIPK
jgi:hypothetical protein